MDRDELIEVLAMGPIKITINDGKEYEILDDQYLVGDMSLMTLHRYADGKLKLKVLPFVTMSGVESMEASEN